MQPSTPELPPPRATLPAAGTEDGAIPWAGYGFAALGALLFSTKGIAIKLAYAESVNAETLLALRMALSLPFYAGIGMLSLLDRRRVGRPLPPFALVWRAAAVGILGYWFASYADFLGLLYVSAQFERLILFTYPAFVVLFGALFFNQPFRLRAAAGIGVSYAGLVVIFATSQALGEHAARGAAFVLASAIAFALYQLLAKGLIAQCGPRLFTCIAMIAAAAAALLQFVLTQPLSHLLVSTQVFVYGLFIAIGATVLPTFLISAALGRVSAQANAAIGTLSPVLTILLAVAILGEPFTLVDAGGTALVIAGVAWFTLAERRG